MTNIFWLTFIMQNRHFMNITNLIQCAFSLQLPLTIILQKLLWSSASVVSKLRNYCPSLRCTFIVFNRGYFGHQTRVLTVCKQQRLFLYLYFPSTLKLSTRWQVEDIHLYFWNREYMWYVFITYTKCTLPRFSWVSMATALHYLYIHNLSLNHKLIFI